MLVEPMLSPIFCVAVVISEPLLLEVGSAVAYTDVNYSFSTGTGVNVGF